MKHTDTICYKIERLTERLKKESVPGEEAAFLLMEIREDAQHMENALRARKKHMEEEDIERSYQNRKKDTYKGKDIPGVNNIVGKPKVTATPTDIEIIVRDKDKILYQKKSRAGIVCSVEKIEDMKPNDPYTYGQTQNFEWGPPGAIVFAADQLQQATEKYKLIILNALKELKLAGKNKPEDFMNKMNELLKKKY